MDEYLNRQQQSLVQSDGKSGDPIYRAIKTSLKDLASNDGKLLDYGAGRGFFIKQLLSTDNKYEVWGADLLEKPKDIEPISKWIKGDLNKPLEVENDSFDIITGIEIIEHLENPRAVAREWFRLLRPGGVLVCSTPNNLSIRSILSLTFRGHFLEFGPRSYPSHITPLLAIDIKRVLDEAGFIDIKIGYSNYGKIPKLKSLSWQDISLGFLKGRLFSDNLVASAIKPT